MAKGYLILQSGQVFEGMLCGSCQEAVGELVFSTGMVGYLEALTDPGYCGQMLLQTFPLIGNYGVIGEDVKDAKPALSAYITRELCDAPSNFRADGSLNAYLKENGIPGITGVDTRQITRILREQGTMNAMISFTAELTEAQKETLNTYTVTGAVAKVACTQRFTEGSGKKVALLDYGAKADLRRALIARGCEVITLPGNTPQAEIQELGVDGIVLSNGPGDPAENVKAIRQICFLLEQNIPMLGIGLGHQLMALAFGGKTRKMKYGHRGANQPSQNIETGRVYITSQNHGYCVVADSLREGAKVTFVNANDGTCEGIRYTAFPGLSVQFHPDEITTPQNTGFVYDQFIAMMEEGK